MNNVRAFPNTGAIKDEAAAWVVKVQGYTYKTDEGLPDEQALKLKAWMAQSPEHREYFLKMLGGWDAMGMLEDLADILPLAEIQHRQKASISAKIADRVAQKTFVFGMSGALAVGCAVVIWLALFATPQSLEYMTEKGQQASYILDDGSTISLNTDTQLSVEFSEERRVVTLSGGEANFEVSKDASRPFVVYAGDGMVWAVGTAFNVDYRNEQVNVIVSEGTVKVFSGITLRDQEPLLLIDDSSSSTGIDGISLSEGQESEYFRELVLDAGESAQYSQSRVFKESVEPQEIVRDLAWQEGVLIFQGETLEQALEEIARYTDRQLVIVDPAIRGASVGGRFKTDDIDVLVDSLAIGLDIKTEYGEGDSILFSSK